MIPLEEQVKERQPPVRIQHSLRRALRAQWRDARVLLSESRGALILFFTLVLRGAVIFYTFYTDPVTGQSISFPKALFSAFGLIFLQGTLNFPASFMTTSLPPTPQHATRLKALLARIRHFDGLPPEVRDRIAASAVPRHFPAGQVIYIEGEPAECFYLLERGWVKATRMTRDGREQAMLFLESGEIFGDIAVFSDTPYPGTVVALEDVDVWAIPAPEFLALAEQYPALAMAIIRHLSDLVLHYIGLVEDLSLRKVEARLANTLRSTPKRVTGN